MRNPFFKYKQFTVYHDKCAMKVGTDGSMLGAWTNATNALHALDIGTGSGLLALMIAQKNTNLLVDAIDIDSGAIEQARENIMNSPFADRIRCEQTAIQDYKPVVAYDLIISNPPFFTETLQSPDKQRATARHADSLPIEDLIKYSASLLSDKGRISLIYPVGHQSVLISLAEKYGLYLSRMTTVYPTPQSEPKRILMDLSKCETEAKEDELIIEIDRHTYSEEFKNLVRDFYIRRV